MRHVRVLVLGAHGQIGHCLMAAQWPSGVIVFGATRADVDLTQPAMLDAKLAECRPDLVINAAAYTAVDKAESEPAVAVTVNATAVAHLARRCADSGTPLLHMSTDYVFDGVAAKPYLETDPVGPLGVYGESKLAGEAAVRATLIEHVILRTSWVYGVHGHNFVKTMLRLGTERDTVNVVADQHGAPTSAIDIATALVAIATRILSDRAAGAGSALWGTYHFAAAGETTWHGLAQYIFADMQRRTGRSPTCKPITTAEYPLPARRPANSRLNCSKFDATFAVGRGPWQQSVDRVLHALVNPLET